VYGVRSWILTDSLDQGAPTGDRGSLRVLILEDQESDTRLLLRALHRSGFEVTPRVVASRGQFLEALDEEFDLVLADYTLPDLNAAEALQTLNERQLDIPVIVVTGAVSEDVVVECMRLGAADYLLKDRLARLGEAVKRALRESELQRENRQAELDLQRAREQAEVDYQALLGRLRELAQRVGVASEQRDVYRALFDFCMQSTPAESILVSSFDPQTQLRTCVYSAQTVKGELEENDVSRLPKMPLNKSPQSRAVANGQIVLTDNYEEERQRLGFSTVLMGSDATERPPLSSAAVPLKFMGRTIGGFEVQSGELAAFREAHLTALGMAANHAAVALENVRLLKREREQRQAAQNSERRYRELIDQASDGIVVFDESGYILQTNRTFERMVGAASGSLVGTSTREMSVPQERDGRERYEELAEGESALSERVIRRRDGTEMPVETNTRRLGDRTFQSIIRDITERKQGERELLNEKLFSDTVINSLPGIFYLFGERNRFVRWNTNLNVVTGYDDHEIASMAPLDFFVPEEHSSLAMRVEETVRSGSAAAGGRLLAKDGTTIPYYFSSVRLVMNGQTYVMGTGVDVSQQLQAEDREKELNLELEKRLARISALHEIDMAITGSVDMRLTLNVVLDNVIRELGVDAATVWVYERANQGLVRLASKGLPGSTSRILQRHLGEGPVGRCGLEQKLVRLNTQELGAKLRSDGIGGEFSGYVAVPLVSKGQLQGVLEVFASREMETGDDWLEFLEALALQAAIAIDNVTLFQNLQRSTVELTLSYDATIEGWARALDLRDHETEGHSRRVTELTVNLARKMGVGEEALAHIRRGALLHDIGKLGVPDAILTKPGKLDAQEKDVMQRHAKLGYELLAPIAFLLPAIDIPYCHHEAWDGSGYPRGLKGEEIPLAARIFAAADVFDALTSDRPYRSAWTDEKALRYLQERSGLQFDPRVVSAFVELYQDERGGPGGSDRSTTDR
jgi:PAS domain S-box-containing protein/putative nucleotidyltransferase with HDIG domain